MADLMVGKISHYFDKIGVAVLEITEESLNAGDTIKVVSSAGEFEQTVGSMQVEHENVETAEKGMAVGIKLDQKVRKGDEVYKVA